MNEFRSDEEQVEAIKTWWKENGKSIVIGLLIGLVGVFGWRTWSAKRETAAEQASISYQKMLTNLTDKKPEVAKELGQELTQNHDGSAYGALAGLLLAKMEAEAGDLDKAVEHLRWVVEHAKVQAFNTTAQLRLARILLQQNKVNDAWNILTAMKEADDLAVFQEIKGDVLAVLDKKEEARNAYQQALSLLSPFADRNLLQMKIDDLGLAEQDATPAK